FTGHRDRVRAVAFSPDGKDLATGSTDETARIWQVNNGDTLLTLQPCSSPVSSVAFSPDGKKIVTGVAARNDLFLDTVPRNGNDINLTQPTQFDLTDVPPGQYYLWAEIQTDRTTPVRTYSQTIVNVVPSFTGTVDSFTPRVPLIDDEASILFDNNNQRQIV